ncbi:Nif3-like dinuclear metal center hexameric protein [Ferrimonas sediminicola]|uniref:GTP cyclohydrolase 1 type 2 homolog n=1 Tax=Ferrimonas sediminicola TaxID=2569538 RepID=A0A4U1BIR3_9GAMM|nr:Nif3-like dinuclear metal center hexameric protein [Ferrimonas sediminicola]TKB50459.1 Nif3-like dinuclear metal center hexameric protein [Ferrimonas sediminicola]
MKRHELLHALDQLLTPRQFKDYAPNGLQVEGREEIRRIVTAVTAGQSAIDSAIEQGADALLVHHGYFWKGESPVITGMKRNRLKALLDNDINLIGYHLPLDAHPTLGNNACLAKALGLALCGPMEAGNDLSIPVWGRFDTPVTETELCRRIDLALGRQPLCISGHDRPISTLGICSGGAPDYIDLAAELDLDAYLSGEVAERTFYSARELGVSYFAAGHHATERGGIQALGAYLHGEYGLQVTFVDVDNPV